MKPHALSRLLRIRSFIPHIELFDTRYATGPIPESAQHSIPNDLPKCPGASIEENAMYFRTLNTASCHLVSTADTSRIAAFPRHGIVGNESNAI